MFAEIALQMGYFPLQMVYLSRLYPGYNSSQLINKAESDK